MSPDGTKSAHFYGYSNKREIYIGQTNLIKNDYADIHSAWSPDGTKIIFASYHNNNLDIFIMNTDGSNQINLTNTPAADEYYPYWVE